MAGVDLLQAWDECGEGCHRRRQGGSQDSEHAVACRAEELRSIGQAEIPQRCRRFPCRSGYAILLISLIAPSSGNDMSSLSFRNASCDLKLPVATRMTRIELEVYAVKVWQG